MKSGWFAFVTACGLLALGSQAAQAQGGATRPHDHQADVRKSGDQVMGFSHDKATHHFRLYSDGGAIEVNANDRGDTVTRDMIRMHLNHIAKMFAAGDFNAPMLIHDQVPPGVPALRRLRAAVKYRFEETPQGARVRIVTSHTEALRAVHEFLRFQITDHQTGDALEVTQAPKT